jgi:SSS family solute:Na+ symporter
MLKLSLLDFAVIVAYLGSLWGMGLYVAFRHRREDESFLLNRHFGWFNIGSSIFATNIGPSFLLGAVSAAYATGMVTASFEWLAWIFLFLLSIVFAPHYIRMRISTMPDFIRRRFGPRAAAFLSWYGLFTITVMWVGGDMFVGGRLLNQILG